MRTGRAVSATAIGTSSWTASKMGGNPDEALSVTVARVHTKGPSIRRYEWRCPVCQKTYWTGLSRKTETCSIACAGKLRSERKPSKSDREKRAAAGAFVAEVNARTFCAHCGAQPVEWHNPDHVELNRTHFRIGRMVSFGKTARSIEREMALCTPLCRRCHMKEDGRLKKFIDARGGRRPKKAG